MDRAIFFDRDGTLIEDKHYLGDPEEVEWYDGAFESIRRLRDAGYKLIIVTNQSGVARGKITESDVESVHDRITADLKAHDLTVDDFYYCPYHTEAKLDEYRKDSSLRKPSPGMLMKARGDHDLDLANSYMVGDKPSDVRAGLRAGTNAVLVRTGKEIDADEEFEPATLEGIGVIDSVADLADYVSNEQPTDRD